MTLPNNPPLIRNKRGLLENKRPLLENNRGLLPDKGTVGVNGVKVSLISKSNTKK